MFTMSDRQYPSRPWVSAHVLIFNNTKSELLLTKRASPPKQFYWFPPGGAIDLGEAVEAGIKREVLEETGVNITNLQYIKYLDAITKDERGEIRFHYVVFMFRADFQGGTVTAMDDALEAKWIPITDIQARRIPIPEELLIILDEIGMLPSPI